MARRCRACLRRRRSTRPLRGAGRLNGLERGLGPEVVHIRSGALLAGCRRARPPAVIIPVTTFAERAPAADVVPRHAAWTCARPSDCPRPIEPSSEAPPSVPWIGAPSPRGRGCCTGSAPPREGDPMKALVWHGKEDIRCDTVSDPGIEHAARRHHQGDQLRDLRLRPAPVPQLHPGHAARRHHGPRDDGRGGRGRLGASTAT